MSSKPFGICANSVSLARKRKIFCGLSQIYYLCFSIYVLRTRANYSEKGWIWNSFKPLCSASQNVTTSSLMELFCKSSNNLLFSQKSSLIEESINVIPFCNELQNNVKINLESIFLLVKYLTERRSDEILQKQTKDCSRNLN